MSTFQLSPASILGAPHLQVADMQRALAFYRDMLGFTEVTRTGATVALSANGARPQQLLLTALAAPQPRPARATGLYHIAILLPTRTALARLINRLRAAEYPFQGASDHGVSEAFYLADPEGNGLELYVDRPREKWPMVGDHINMLTTRLNVADLLAQAKLDESPWAGIDPGTTVGHMHLQVANLDRAVPFYRDVLGLDMIIDGRELGFDAAFLSVGGYHHHIGMNTWESLGAAPPPPDAVGLRAYTWVLPDEAEVQRLLRHLQEHNIAVSQDTQTNVASFADPDSITIEVVASE